ncbi:MAG: YqcC family protein [Pseudomonadota bacterium]
MTDTRESLRSVTESIAAEMQRLSLWESNAPSAQALSSEEPFCYDTLSFAQWMQWIFLPRMREVLDSDRPMPERSNIHAYAEEVMKNSDADTDQLLFLIKTFDELVAAGSTAVLPGVHQSSSRKLLS